MTERFASAAADVFPGYFTLVLPMGIVSNGPYLLVMPPIVLACRWSGHLCLSPTVDVVATLDTVPVNIYQGWPHRVRQKQGLAVITPAKYQKWPIDPLQLLW